VSRNLLAFAAAAFFEIAGCFAFWVWLRRGASPLVALLGVASLVAFGVTLARVDSVFAGRAYAAYGGIKQAALQSSACPHQPCLVNDPRVLGLPGRARADGANLGPPGALPCDLLLPEHGAGKSETRTTHISEPSRHRVMRGRASTESSY
jgi:hypothetical protein